MKKLSVRKIKTHSRFIAGGALGILGVAAVFFFVQFGVPRLLQASYLASSPVLGVSTTTGVATEPVKPSVPHVALPTPVRAVYMTACVSGTPSMRTSLVEFIKKTELNAVIIDIKDFTGGISFPVDGYPDLAPYESKSCGANDMKEFVQSLHEADIYVIGRITVFQDPLYAKAHPGEAVQSKNGGVWKDNKGLSFIDVGSHSFWDYIVKLSDVSYNDIGFDELNYDYIRFPSDGPMSLAVYTHSQGKSKAQALEEFFQYLSEKVKPMGVVMSADLFGMTATNEDDLNIGQVLERALPYFDFVDPMVYPSHYPSGFNGYKNVNQHAYDIVKFSMDRAVARAIATSTPVETLSGQPIMKEVVIPAHGSVATTTEMQSSGLYTKESFAPEKIRPWLQSFDYPVTYTPAMVREQIQATYDAGLQSWLFWDAANKYTALRSTLTQSASGTAE